MRPSLFLLAEGFLGSDTRGGVSSFFVAAVLSPADPASLRFCFVDFTVAGALRFAQGLENVVLCYDQACKYFVNFRQRMETHFPGLEGLENITFLVNKAHIRGHNEGCWIQFNPNYRKGSGRADAEGGERNWSVLNLNASTTREMSKGHRRDALNDHLNWSNFRKLLGMGKSL